MEGQRMESDDGNHHRSSVRSLGAEGRTRTPSRVFIRSHLVMRRHGLMELMPLLLVVVVALASVALACEQKQMGCKIEGHSCVCGEGCPGQYRFATKTLCHRALNKGNRRGSRDICYRNPCSNNGACVQSSQEPGYKCRCEGTGYYGNRCQHDCTTANNLEAHNYPYECVMI